MSTIVSGNYQSWSSTKQALIYYNNDQVKQSSNTITDMRSLGFQTITQVLVVLLPVRKML